MVERRKFLRLAQDIPVRHMVSGEQWVELTKAENISTGGAQLSSDSGIAVGSKVKIELDMPGFTEPFYAHGEVVWSRPNERGKSEKKYALGVRFVRVVNRGEMKEF